MASQYKASIDDLLQATIGSIDKAILNNLFGFNHLQIPSAVPSNREQPGLTFFTRPQLNLQLDNVRNARKFMPLASDRETAFFSASTSIHRFIRTTLDPRLMVGYTRGRTSIPAISCPLVNNNLSFIPVLTNNVLTVSGWPDLTVPLFTSRPGRHNESVAFADGLVENKEQYSVDVSFRNTEQDPILYLFYIWTLYMQYVFEGRFVPYPDFIVDQKLDYNTRIFRVRLDRNRRKVTKIMSTGPAIPVACSVGEFADLNVEEIISTANKTINMRFQCQGFEMFDQRLIFEFNAIGQMFKSEMKDVYRELYMIKVPPYISQYFQHRAYPRIDPDTHEMQWWVDRSLFNARTQALLLTLSEIEVENAQQFADESDIELAEGG